MFDREDNCFLCDECGERKLLRSIIVVNSVGQFERKELCSKCLPEYLPIVKGSEKNGK